MFKTFHLTGNFCCFIEQILQILFTWFRKPPFSISPTLYSIPNRLQELYEWSVQKLFECRSVEFIRLTTHQKRANVWSNILLSEYLIDISTFRNHLVVNQWLTIPKWIFSLFSLASNPISQRTRFFLDRFFTFTFINNQPKQMVIFKSLPILSFHIFWEIIFFVIYPVSLSCLIFLFLIYSSLSHVNCQFYDFSFIG